MLCRGWGSDSCRLSLLCVLSTSYSSCRPSTKGGRKAVLQGALQDPINLCWWGRGVGYLFFQWKTSREIWKFLLPNFWAIGTWLATMQWVRTAARCSPPFSGCLHQAPHRAGAELVKVCRRRAGGWVLPYGWGDACIVSSLLGSITMRNVC